MCCQFIKYRYEKVQQYINPYLDYIDWINNNNNNKKKNRNNTKEKFPKVQEPFSLLY